MKTMLYLLISFLTLWACKEKNTKTQPPQTNAPYVVVLSLDGFRWDYTDMVETPNFDRLAKIGVKANSLQPSFPSKTFPNHYTIATGLYPGNHGLVNNTFYDFRKNVVYKISNRQAVSDKDFYGGEPIWNTAEKQGVKAACFFWVGSEAPVQDMRPSMWKVYDHDFDWDSRADSIVKWLDMPKLQRPHLVMWYLHEPDGTGHKYGPKSDQVKELTVKLDAYLGKFMDKLDKLPHRDKINLIVTTDHGMGSTSSERYVALQNHLDSKKFKYILQGNPVIFLEPKQSEYDECLAALRKVEHVKVYEKGKFPEKWRYNNNERISELVVVADSAWSVGWSKATTTWNGGTHGYPPTNKDMHGIFYAQGPAFKKDYKHKSFQNVDIYSLVTHILGLKAASNDGDFERVKGMLKSE